MGVRTVEGGELGEIFFQNMDTRWTHEYCRSKTPNYTGLLVAKRNKAVGLDPIAGERFLVVV